MVLAAPRSATTWASNWLTTEKTVCLHDPLWRYDLDDLDRLVENPGGKMLGVSCTGLPLFPDWVNDHPARKVILHRDVGEINCSLAQLGFGTLDPQWDGALRQLLGLHCDWTDLFSPVHAKHIYEYLTQSSFDAYRHAQLVGLNIQPHFDRVRIDRAATQRLLQRMQEAATS